MFAFDNTKCLPYLQMCVWCVWVCVCVCVCVLFVQSFFKNLFFNSLEASVVFFVRFHIDCPPSQKGVEKEISRGTGEESF